MLLSSQMRAIFCIFLIVFAVTARRIPTVMAQTVLILQIDNPLFLQLQREISVLDIVDYQSGDPLEKSVPSVVAAKKFESKTIRLSVAGVVRSTNPVWNVCVSGHSIPLGLIRRNRDTYHYRRGHVKKEIPFTCRDYHRGDVSVWSHPDFPDLQLTLDSKGHLKGGIQEGYIAVRDNPHAKAIDPEGSVAKFLRVPLLFEVGAR